MATWGQKVRRRHQTQGPRAASDHRPEPHLSPDRAVQRAQAWTTAKGRAPRGHRHRNTTGQRAKRTTRAEPAEKHRKTQWRRHTRQRTQHPETLWDHATAHARSGRRPHPGRLASSRHWQPQERTFGELSLDAPTECPCCRSPSSPHRGRRQSERAAFGLQIQASHGSTPLHVALARSPPTQRTGLGAPPAARRPCASTPGPKSGALPGVAEPGHIGIGSVAPPNAEIRESAGSHTPRGTRRESGGWGLRPPRHQHLRLGEHCQRAHRFKFTSEFRVCRQPSGLLPLDHHTSHTTFDTHLGGWPRRCQAQDKTPSIGLTSKKKKARPAGCPQSDFEPQKWQLNTDSEGLDLVPVTSDEGGRSSELLRKSPPVRLAHKPQEKERVVTTRPRTGGQNERRTPAWRTTTLRVGAGASFPPVDIQCPGVRQNPPRPSKGHAGRRGTGAPSPECLR